MTDIYEFSVPTPDGGSTSLEPYRGQVMLIVNTASKCGFTPQYAGLEALQREFNRQGFTVLGFPCNQFGKQEPGDAAEIASFCTTHYAVSFPVLGKIEVNGAGALPLYRWLEQRRPGLFGIGRIKWNFTKFLVGRNGEVLARYAPTRTPDKLRPAIQQALAVS